MDNEDMSEIIQKLSSMINNSNQHNINNKNNTTDDVSSNSNNISEDTIQNVLNNFNNQSSDNSSNAENNFNFDMNTILKMKSIMDKVNSNKNDPRANLLLSLKPYLNNERKQKLDQYMQFLNISKIIEAFGSDGGVNIK